MALEGGVSWTKRQTPFALQDLSLSPLPHVLFVLSVLLSVHAVCMVYWDHAHWTLCSSRPGL